jgi:hypothetical protein
MGRGLHGHHAERLLGMMQDCLLLPSIEEAGWVRKTLGCFFQQNTEIFSNESSLFGNVC